MINCSDFFKQEISNPYRDQGHLNFNILTNKGVTSQIRTQQMNGDGYINAPIYDNITWGDDIATLENKRWLLDGSMHSLYVNNISKYPLDIDSHYVSNTEHNIVGFDIHSVPGDILLKFKDSRVPVTDKITIIWDPVLKQAPINYRIRYTYANATQYLKFQQGEIDSLSWRREFIMGPSDLYAYKYTFKIPEGVVAIEEIKIETSYLGFQWSEPNSRVRLSEVILGNYYNENSDGLNLTSCKVSKDISFLNNSKPNYSATLTFDNTSKMFDPLQQKGIITELSKGMQIPLRWGIKHLDSLNNDIMYTTPEQWILDSWECTSNSNEFKLNLIASVDYLDIKYYPKTFIYGEKKRTPGYFYSIISWINDILDYQYDNRNKKRNPKDTILMEINNPYALNSVNGWPLIEDMYTILQKFAQCFCAYLSIDMETGNLKMSSLPMLNRVFSNHITENEIIESPAITENNEAIKEILFNEYLLTLTNINVDVRKTLGEEDVAKNIIMPFGEYKQDEHFTGNVLGLPDTYYGYNVDVTEFTYYGREADFFVNSVGSEGYIGANVTNATIEQIVQNVYSLGTSGKTLTIDNNNFINSVWTVYSLIQKILPIINASKNISVKTIGEVYIEPGDYICIETEYGNFNVLVSKTTIDFNGGFTGTIEGKVIK